VRWGGDFELCKVQVIDTVAVLLPKPSKVERLDRTGLDYMRCGTSTGIPIASTAHAHQNKFSMRAASGSVETKMMQRPRPVPDVLSTFSSGRKE